MPDSIPDSVPSAGTAYEDQDFSNLDLTACELEDCTFTRCTFENTRFRSGQLQGAQFFHCQFNDAESEAPADFSAANLREAEFHHCNLNLVSFERCRGYGLSFNQCHMQGLNLSMGDFRLPVGDSELAELNILDCNLSFANLSNNYLAHCAITGNRMLEASLEYTDFTEADLSNNEMHGISANGVTLRGADLRGTTWSNLDPRQIDLTGVKLLYEQLPALIEPLEIELCEE